MEATKIQKQVAHQTEFFYFNAKNQNQKGYELF